MMKRSVFVVVVTALMSACGPGSANGSVGGVSLSVADAIFAVIKDDMGKQLGLFVAMADKPNLCDSLKANRQPKSATSLVFAMVRYNAAGEELAPDVGDYTVVEQVTQAGNYASANFARTDANCTDTLSPNATVGRSGLVKLSALKSEANGTAQATFDVTFGAGDKVTGSFNAKFCDVASLSASPNCE